MDGHVSVAESNARLATLQEALNAQQLQRNRRQIGTIQSVLVEGTARKGIGELTGRTPGFRKVNFPGDSSLIRRIIPIEITEGLANSLRGEITNISGKTWM